MIRILYAGDNRTMAYAASELSRYLEKVSGTPEFGEICPVDKLPAQPAAGEILLGLLDELACTPFDITDPELEDAEDICIRGGSGYIAGSNPRSVLFGVYDYFKSMGCSWVRPGDGGEHLVSCDPMTHDFTYRKKADTLFRGECLEGAVKYEHLRAAVEWAPKVHMNLTMIQGIVPYNFMSRWYRHRVSTVRPPEDIGYDGVAGLISLLEQDIARVGLQLHALGHCYQTEPYGLHYQTSSDRYPLPDRVRRALAQVGGERRFRGSPSWTQLCMGNEDVLREQVQWLADYAQRKPWIDFLHVWLGDGINNHCECPLCLPHHPSDLYVKMLNMLDAELTRRNIATRLVFISYTDTLWAPTKERLRNPKRFLFCTALGDRDYGVPYDDTPCDAPIPAWERNHFNAGGGFPLRRKMLREWQKQVDVPMFAFEYHFYTDHYNDPTELEIAENYYADLHQLRSLGFDGMMNCQTQRCALPTAFAVMLCGESLFDLNRSYESLRDSYFAAAFGENYRFVLDYLTGLRERFVPRSLRKTVSIDSGAAVTSDDAVRYWRDDPDAAARFASIPAWIDAHLAQIAAGEQLEAPCHARSWKLLGIHADFCRRLAGVLELGAAGDMDSARRAYDALIHWLSVREPEMEYEFDLYLFNQLYTAKLN